MFALITNNHAKVACVGNVDSFLQPGCADSAGGSGGRGGEASAERRGTDSRVRQDESPGPEEPGVGSVLRTPPGSRRCWLRTSLLSTGTPTTWRKKFTARSGRDSPLR
jgi:hypothetical protein